MDIQPAKTINSDEKFEKALRIIKGGITTLVVLKDGKYAGIVTDKALTSMQHTSEAKVISVCWKAPVLTRGMELDDITKRFTEGYRELAVVEKGELIGTVRHLDILNELKEQGRIPKKRVIELMSSPLVTMDIDSSIAQAAALMRKNSIHHLVVTDNSKYVGIISTADIQPLLEKFKDRLPMATERKGQQTISLRSVFLSSPEIYNIRKSVHLTEAVDEMTKRGVSALVVYDGKPLGLIHAIHILRASLPSAEPPLEITGLTIEEKEMRDDIRRECLNTLKRISKVMPIEMARLTVKSHSKTGSKHKYSLRFLVSGKHTLETNAFHWKLFSALNDVLHEMEDRVMKVKDKEKGKKSGRKRASSIRIHTGELYPGKPMG